MCKKNRNCWSYFKRSNIYKPFFEFSRTGCSRFNGKKGRANDHVPYHQSKLIHILKGSIGGIARPSYIWPEEQYLQETLYTFNFAQRIGGVVNITSVNIQLDINAQIRKMTKEIKELKQELVMYNNLANRGRINYDPYSPNEQKAQMEAAKNF